MQCFATAKVTRPLTLSLGPFSLQLTAQSSKGKTKVKFRAYDWALNGMAG